MSHNISDDHKQQHFNARQSCVPTVAYAHTSTDLMDCNAQGFCTRTLDFESWRQSDKEDAIAYMSINAASDIIAAAVWWCHRGSYDEIIKKSYHLPLLLFPDA